MESEYPLIISTDIYKTYINAPIRQLSYAAIKIPLGKIESRLFYIYIIALRETNMREDLKEEFFDYLYYNIHYTDINNILSFPGNIDLIHLFGEYFYYLYTNNYIDLQIIDDLMKDKNFLTSSLDFTLKFIFKDKISKDQDIGDIEYIIDERNRREYRIELTRIIVDVGKKKYFEWILDKYSYGPFYDKIVDHLFVYAILDNKIESTLNILDEIGVNLIDATINISTGYGSNIIKLIEKLDINKLTRKYNKGEGSYIFRMSFERIILNQI